MNIPNEYIGCDMHGRKLVGVAGEQGSVIIQAICGEEDDGDDNILSVHQTQLRKLAAWLASVANDVEERHPPDDEAALRAFTAYLVENYPPGCVLSSPSWHAEKLFRAAKRAMKGTP